jgi:predicted anti-sigma-YlaC factor YlaD
MDCQELVELVTDYLEGALPDTRAAEVDTHLRECVDCLRYLGQIQLTAQLLRRLTAS